MDWKKFAIKLLRPPVWALLLLTAASAAGLAALFLNGLEQTLIAYPLYVLAFYTLTVDCIFCAKELPGRVGQAKEKVYSTELGNRYMTDPAFRAKVSLHLSLYMNLLYVAVNLFSWYRNRSWWFLILAVYYLTLSVMRFLLVGYVRRYEIGVSRIIELRLSIICSVILLTLNFFLSGAVLMILYQNKGYDYGSILIYVMALYTFYQTIHAAVDLVKYRKRGSPVMSTVKVIALASALVSMLNLETAMFAQFGGSMPENQQQLMIILTGAGVALTVVTMSVYNIVRSCKEIKKLRSA